MSTQLDYQRRAYKYVDKYNEPCYVVLHEAGSSNCFDARTGRRARDWQVLADGWMYSVCGRITRYAASAAGGMLHLGGMGRHHSNFTDVKKVIRVYEKVIANALPIEQATTEDKAVIESYRAKKLQEVA